MPPQPPASIWLSTQVNYETYIQRWAQANRLPYYPGMHQDILNEVGNYGRRSPLDMQRFAQVVGETQMKGWLYGLAYRRYLESFEEESLSSSLPGEWVGHFEGMSSEMEAAVQLAFGRVSGVLVGHIRNYRDFQKGLSVGQVLRDLPGQQFLADIGGYPALPGTNTRPEIPLAEAFLSHYMGNRLGQIAGNPQSPDHRQAVLDFAREGKVDIATGVAAATQFTHTGFKGSVIRQRKYAKGATLDGKKVGGKFGSRFAFSDQEKKLVGDYLKHAFVENYDNLIHDGTTGNLKRAVEQATVDLTIGGPDQTETVLRVTLGEVQYQRKVPDAAQGFRWVSRSTNEYGQYVFFGSGPKRPRNAKAMTWFEGNDRQVYSRYVAPTPPRNIFELTPTQNNVLVALLTHIFGDEMQNQLVQT